MKKSLIILSFLICALLPASAQKSKKEKIGKANTEAKTSTEGRIAAYAVGFYNLENLFDTLHAKGKNDFDFLPNGLYKWDALRYGSKVKHMSRVLGELATDKIKAGCAIIGVSEVENRAVLEDLLRQDALSKRGYRILHAESPDRRGVDCAILYNPRFFQLEDSLYIYYIYPNATTGDMPVGFTVDADNNIHPTPLYGDTSRITRGFLVGIGTMANEKMAVIVNHWPSRGAPSAARERAAAQVYLLKEALIKKYPGIKIIIEGDLNDNPNNKSVVNELKCVSEIKNVKNGINDLYNPWYNTLYKTGQGTLLYDGKWDLFDQIILSGNFINGTDYSTLTYKNHEVFIRDYLIEQKGKYKGAPARTTAGGTWQDGYSDHLPTIVYLVKRL